MNVNVTERSHLEATVPFLEVQPAVMLGMKMTIEGEIGPRKGIGKGKEEEGVSVRWAGVQDHLRKGLHGGRGTSVMAMKGRETELEAEVLRAQGLDGISHRKLSVERYPLHHQLSEFVYRSQAKILP